MATDASQSYANSPTGNVISSLPMDVSGGNQTLAAYPNGFHATTAGNVVGQLMGDSADRTFGVVAGAIYPYRFKSVTQTGTTATGVFLYTV